MTEKVYTEETTFHHVDDHAHGGTEPSSAAQSGLGEQETGTLRDALEAELRNEDTSAEAGDSAEAPLADPDSPGLSQAPLFKDPSEDAASHEEPVNETPPSSDPSDEYPPDDVPPPESFDQQGYGDDPEIGYIVISSEEDATPDASAPHAASHEDMEDREQDPAMERHAEVLDRITSLSEQMDQLGRDFESKLKYDSHKEQVIDSLHKELQEHKDGLLRQHMQSMVMDIVKVIDDVRKIVRHYREKELQDSDLPKVLDILEDLPSDLEDTFSFQGIRPYQWEDEEFNPARQRVLQKIETDDESLDKKIAKRLLPGYEWDDKIIRLEMVGVYTYKPASDNQ